MKKRMLLVSVFFLVTACGGGSSNKAEINNPDQLKGLFATGSGQKGSILVKGSSGNITAAISDQSGNFVVDLSGLTAPYKIKAESLGKDIVFYSYTENSTYTNVNQMTTSIFEDVAPQNNTEELFDSNVVINKSLLNEAEEALKNNLLVQIYSSGLEPDKLQIFKSKFTANNLGYDELLDKLSDKSTPKIQSELTVEESKAISRIKSHLYITDDNSVNLGKIDKDLVTEFLAEIVKSAIDKEYIDTIYNNDGSIAKYLVKDGVKAFTNNVMINVAKQSLIEIIGTATGFSDADINFITELSSIKFKNNIYDAVAVLYLGLQGEDTSKIHDPLLVALQKSTLGDPIVASEKFIDFFGTHGTISRFICNLDDATAGTPSSALGEILNFNRTENCQFFENDNTNTLSDYTIDFQTNQVVNVNYNNQPFRVTGVYPDTGNVVDSSDMINPTIFVNFNRIIDSSSVSSPFAMNVINLTTGHSLVCNRLYVLAEFQHEGDQATSIECAFDDINLKYNSKYAFSVTAVSGSTNDKLTVASTFSTPDYPVKTIELSSPSGRYDKPISLSITAQDGVTYFYTVNDANMKKSNLKEYTGVPIELSDTSILRVLAFKWGGFNYLQVSPVMEFPYTIIVKTEENEASDDEVNNDTTPIDTSSLTVQECKEKTLNQTFATNTWTSVLSDWNAVVIACTSILANDQINDNNSEEDTSNNSKTSISYMKSHPNVKLASIDCNAKSYNDWKASKSSLVSDLAPSTNMMKSIEGCISVKQLIDIGGLSFSKAVESVVRMQKKEKSPFSDAFDSSAGQTGTTDNSIDDIGDQQDAFAVYTALIQQNTVSTCKAKYGQYSFLQLATIASTPRAEDIAVGQPINGDASYCQTLLLQSGDLTP